MKNEYSLVTVTPFPVCDAPMADIFGKFNRKMLKVDKALQVNRTQLCNEYN
jgi:hypothetical protein